MSEASLVQRGELQGHNGWVTAIAVPSANPAADVVISASRDKSIIVWKLNLAGDSESAGDASERLEGHNHFVQDVTCTPDGAYILSGSWDNSLRLWDLKKKTSRRFNSHTKDVLSVAFSDDNRQIASGSRDETVKVWNTLGRCKYTFTANGEVISTDRHSKFAPPAPTGKWVTSVRFTPVYEKPGMLVSAYWDKTVKIWALDTAVPKLKTTLTGHASYINALTVAPDGSLCASGSKDGQAKLWDLNQGSLLATLEAGDAITSMVFSPSRFWLCAATTSRIIVWDLESKVIREEIKYDFKKGSKNEAKGKNNPVHCVSLAWSADGNMLFAGYTDNVIRCYAVRQ